MNQEQIRDELVKRANLVMNNYRGSESSKLRALSTTLGNAEEFTKEMTRILNEILKENNLDLDGKEKDEFIEFIQPTFKSLIDTYIKSSN